jgi:ketosteroid isomerase-like protein
VVHRLVDGVVRLVRGDTGQVAALADLYAAHTRVEHPTAPPPATVLRTRADVQRHFAAAAGTGFRPDDYRVEDLVVHDTADPEVVVAEFAYAGSAGGRTFRVCGRPACDPARRVRLA